MISNVINAMGNFLEREAGQIVVSLVLMGIGAAFFLYKVPKGEDIIVFAMGVLARSMVGGKSGPPTQ